MFQDDWKQKVLFALSKIEHHPLGGRLEVTIDPSEKVGIRSLGIFTWLRGQTVRQLIEIEHIDD